MMSNKLLALLSALITFTLVFGGYTFLFANNKSQKLVSPLPESGILIKKSTNLKSISEVQISIAVEDALIGTKGIYGVVIKDLKTGETFTQNENRIFEAASLYKLWIMAETVKRLEEESLKHEQVLSGDIKDLNERFDIATEAAELQEGTVSMTVKEALDEMISISHNYAALLLSAKIRLSNVSKFLKNEGFTASKLGEPPVTNALETAQFLEKIYQKNLVSQKASEQMMNLLKKQEKNNKIPKYLPENVTIAHKTGEIGAFSHDAGIVFLEDRDYLIVILSESNDPRGAEERIAKISKNLYSVFNSE
ncbi:serine hydrolase [Candidatus Gottesmanbacteria bacterium]|nr:serine hydrolase [Candidatus Gottesmanbacteria bacterium]